MIVLNSTGIKLRLFSTEARTGYVKINAECHKPNTHDHLTQLVPIISGSAVKFNYLDTRQGRKILKSVGYAFCRNLTVCFVSYNLINDLVVFIRLPVIWIMFK